MFETQKSRFSAVRLKFVHHSGLVSTHGQMLIWGRLPIKTNKRRCYWGIAAPSRAEIVIAVEAQRGSRA